MKAFYFFICCLLIGNAAIAQNPKSNVFIIGNTPSAAAAAKQSAVSGVYTEWLVQGDLPNFQHLTIGLDTLKNLTIHKTITWQKIQRSGSGFSLKMSDGKTKKAKVLILAGDENALAQLKVPMDSINVEGFVLDYQNPKYRTSIASTVYSGNETQYQERIYSFYDLLIPQQENLIYLPANAPISLGQGAGASAAYACFFGRKLSQGNLKVIQGELYSYKSDLFPLSDVSQTDLNWRALQAIALMGVFKAEKTSQGWAIKPDSIVLATEIRDIYKELYGKSHIWFEDLGAQPFTLENAIDLIAYVGQKTPKQIQDTLQKNWEKGYGLSYPFELGKLVTRREFAIIAQQFMPPFNVGVDKSGKIRK